MLHRLTPTERCWFLLPVRKSQNELKHVDTGIDIPIPSHARTLWGFAQSHGVAGVFACKQAHGVKGLVSVYDQKYVRISINLLSAVATCPQ